MRLTIVRHALAGDKQAWHGPDRERPLNGRGERQAEGLVRALRKRKVRRIISSPVVRCVQTVQPLADATGVAVELWDELGPHGHASGIVTACFGVEQYQNAVLCTHGEVLQTLFTIDEIGRLARQGHLSKDRLLAKGSAWRLEISSSGRVTKLDHLRPRP